MRKTVFLWVALFLISFFTNAQKQERREYKNKKIRALKIAFITEQLSLTSKEAEKFWPVYNKFDSLLHQLERVEKFKLIAKIKENNSIDEISEKEAKSIIKNMAVLDNQVFKIKKEYDKELTKVLSYKKILKLKTTEKDFIRKLMRKYRKKKERK